MGYPCLSYKPNNNVYNNTEPFSCGSVFLYYIELYKRIKYCKILNRFIIFGITVARY